MMRRLTACVIAFSLVFSASLIPKPAHAALGFEDTVHDIIVEIETGATHIVNAAQLALQNSLNVKEFSLDGIAWAVSKMAVQSLTKSVVNWINSGFKGSPAFVTDLEGQLQAVGDLTAGNFLKQISTDPALKSPFQSRIASSVGLAYYLSTAKDVHFEANGYTLNKVTPNDAAFLNGDFSKGGWSSWYAATMHSMNNPYGAQIDLANDLNVKVTAAKGVATVQLNWGQGFMSWCGDVDTAHNNNAGNNGDITQPITVTALKTTDPSGCRKSDGTPGQVQTPGSVIQAQINQTLGLSGNTLVTADEFDEIISSLMSQLTSQVIGATGLSGVSSSQSSGRSILDQATDTSQNTAGAGAGASISSAVDSQIAQATEFQKDWQTIQTEAQLAQKCAIGDDMQKVADTLTKAQTALTEATTALTALNTIKTDAAAAGTDASKLTAVGTELQAALTNPPTTEEVVDARTQATDTNDGTTLYSAMEQITQSLECALVI